MEFPLKIRITSKVSYEIVWVDEFDPPENVGLCRFEYKQILLKKGEPDSATFKTLVHEVIHAISHEHDIKIPHKAIYALEHAVDKILRLNGWHPRAKKKSK